MKRLPLFHFQVSFQSCKFRGFLVSAKWVFRFSLFQFWEYFLFFCFFVFCCCCCFVKMFMSKFPLLPEDLNVFSDTVFSSLLFVHLIDSWWLCFWVKFECFSCFLRLLCFRDLGFLSVFDWYNKWASTHLFGFLYASLVVKLTVLILWDLSLTFC